MRRTSKCTWQDYKTNEDVLPALKIYPVVKEIENYIKKWVQRVWRVGRDRLPHLVGKYQPCGGRSHERHFKRLLGCWCDRNMSRDLNRCKLYDYGEDDNEV